MCVTNVKSVEHCLEHTVKRGEKDTSKCRPNFNNKLSILSFSDRFYTLKMYFTFPIHDINADSFN